MASCVASRARAQSRPVSRPSLLFGWVSVVGHHKNSQTLDGTAIGLLISWGGWPGVNVGIYGIHGVSGIDKRIEQGHQ